MATAREDKLTGKIVAGYKVGKLLGQGGAGKVYEAIEVSTGREVALKILVAGLFPTEEFHKRFDREMQVCQKLQHPHIIPIYGYGRLEDARYVAMRLVKGVMLSDLKVDPKMSLRKLLLVVQQTCEALGACHAYNIVHRDLKPTNIMVEGDHAYLLDFGLARHLSGDTISTPQFILGTPMYMSPEQVKGSKVVPASDVFSMGIILYEIFAQKQPFSYDLADQEQSKHSGTLIILDRIAKANFPQITRFNPHLPLPIANVIHKCMSAYPDQRYYNGLTLSQDIAALFKNDEVVKYLNTVVGEIGPAESTQAVTAAMIDTSANRSPVTNLNLVEPPTQTGDTMVAKHAASKIYWIAGIVCAAAILLALSGILVGTGGSEFHKMLAKAEQAEIASNFEEAIHGYTAAITKFPSEYLGYWRRAKLNQRLAQQAIVRRDASAARAYLLSVRDDTRLALERSPVDWGESESCRAMQAAVEKQLSELNK
jgi:serine/threonine protein kinase